MNNRPAPPRRAAHLMTKLSRPIFFNAEIRFFDVLDRKKGWE